MVGLRSGLNSMDVDKTALIGNNAGRGGLTSLQTEQSYRTWKGYGLTTASQNTIIGYRYACSGVSDIHSAVIVGYE